MKPRMQNEPKDMPSQSLGCKARNRTATSLIPRHCALRCQGARKDKDCVPTGPLYARRQDRLLARIQEIAGPRRPTAQARRGSIGATKVNPVNKSVSYRVNWVARLGRSTAATGRM